ncbi:hypothetical protein KI688_004294 [Linnemannia hyalina]|uniref:rRNA 2'-O-methyltransferase fibrillarin n=1 Tax=Linnemannia hyalina TaxID=64524 RepID=A0A9P7XMQ3_9FUNG|nr:hypothetical protein KI688_004294 [Linnemannia hyalina]
MGLGNRGGRGGRGSGRGGFGGDRGGRGGVAKRGGPGGRGARGGAKVTVEPHRHEGIFVAHGKEDLPLDQELGSWRVAAGVLGGVDNIHIAPPTPARRSSTLELPLEPPSPTLLILSDPMVSSTLSSSLIALDATSSTWPRSAPMSSPIIEDARHPHKYRMLVGMVDVIFADVAQPDQSRIIRISAHHFLKNNGHTVISTRANCIDSTVDAATVFAGEIPKLQEQRINPQEQLTLEPFERDRALVVGKYVRK